MFSGGVLLPGEGRLVARVSASLLVWALPVECQPSEAQGAVLAPWCLAEGRHIAWVQDSCQMCAQMMNGLGLKRKQAEGLRRRLQGWGIRPCLRRQGAHS